MRFLHYLILFVVTVAAIWFAERIRPGVLLNSIRRLSFGLAAFVKKQFVKTWIRALILLALLVVLFGCVMLIIEPLSTDKLVVALTNFHLVSGTELEDTKALISHLQDSLWVYKHDIVLMDSVYPEIRDSIKARELGEDVGAHIVIWGSIEKTAIEAEIKPRITVVGPLGKMRLEARQPQAIRGIAVAQLEQISFRERKAREITDVVLFILAFAKYWVDDYDDAVRLFETIQNKNEDTYFYIGNCFLCSRPPDLSRACSLYERATEINPDYAKAHYNWACALSDSGKHQDAIQKLKRVAEIDPDDACAYYAWAYELVKLEKYEEAIEKLKRALEIKPDYPDAHYTLGFSLAQLKRYDEARGSLKIALELYGKQMNNKNAKRTEEFLKALEGK